MTRDESQVSVGGMLALDQVLGDSWSCRPILGLRQPVEDGAQDEAEITGSWPILVPFLGFMTM